MCNKSYQIQRKKKNVAFILALKSIGERYRPSHASCHVHVCNVTMAWAWITIIATCMYIEYHSNRASAKEMRAKIFLL